MDPTARFEAERARLTRIASGVLGDPIEAEDVVQQAWLRWDVHADAVDNPGGWLTTVTTRLCLDRLRARVPEPADPLDQVDAHETLPDDEPADAVTLADTVGAALAVVVDRLGPSERVAFILHDSFGVDFATVAQVLDTTPVAARKLASRARAKVGRPGADRRADAAVVDAFLAAARGGDLRRLLTLLAPDVVVAGDAAAVATGTPERVEGGDAVAAMFDGAAAAALTTTLDGRPGAAWYHRREARVVFDISVEAGVVTRVDLRAEPAVLARVERRRPVTSPDADPSP